MGVDLNAMVTFFAIILTASCSSNTNSPVAANDSIATDAVINTSTSSVALDKDSIPNTTAIVIDSSVYVGVVNSFDSTGEYYISIFSLPHRENENYFEILPGKADSVIHEDIESKRSRIPMNIASEYLNLSGLERISVYNNGQHLTDASLMRVELFNDLIEGKFIAVFKPDQFIGLNWNEAYCVSSRGNSHGTNDSTFEPLEDSGLTKKLLNSFEFDSANVWHTVHVEIMPGEVI